MQARCKPPAWSSQGRSPKQRARSAAAGQTQHTQPTTHTTHTTRSHPPAWPSQGRTPKQRTRSAACAAGAGTAGAHGTRSTAGGEGACSCVMVAPVRVFRMKWVRPAAGAGTAGARGTTATAGGRAWDCVRVWGIVARRRWLPLAHIFMNSPLQRLAVQLQTHEVAQ